VVQGCTNERSDHLFVRRGARGILGTAALSNAVIISRRVTTLGMRPETYLSKPLTYSIPRDRVIHVREWDGPAVLASGVHALRAADLVFLLERRQRSRLPAASICLDGCLDLGVSRAQPWGAAAAEVCAKIWNQASQQWLAIMWSRRRQQTRT